jgi:hypothetical protein
VKETKVLIFDGSVLVSTGHIIFKNQIKNLIAFEQTNIKREIDKEYPDVKIEPDVTFVFESIESIDAVIRALNHLKQNFK